MVTAAKLTRLTHKTEIQIHLVAEGCTICSSRSRPPDRRSLDTYLFTYLLTYLLTPWCNILFEKLIVTQLF
jgi:hypothetical protein